MTNYIPLIFAPILFGVASFVMKSKFVRAEDMDFVTGLDEVIADSYDEPPPKNFWEKFWQWIVSTLNPAPFFRSPYSFAFTVLAGRGPNQQWCMYLVFSTCII